MNPSLNPSPEIDLPAGIVRSISREDLATLPVNRYHGPVHLVTTPHDVAQALADIRQERVTGFDTETRPAFRKGEVYLPCLAQVATARAVYLFPLQHTEAFLILGGDGPLRPQLEQQAAALGLSVSRVSQLHALLLDRMRSLGKERIVNRV